MDYSQYRQYRFNKEAATDHENRMATLNDIGDAIVSQMNTGKHNLSGLSAAEHAMRMNADEWYKKHAPSYIKQRVKAYAGWTKDQNGNFVKNPNTHYDNQFSQEEAIKSLKMPEISNKDKIKAWKNAGKPKDFRDSKKRDALVAQAAASTQDAIVKGFTESAKAKHNIFSDLGGFGMYAAERGQAPQWVGWLGNQYRQNPMLVWGGLAAGVIGIGALVSNFLGGRKQAPQQVIYQQTPPMATTSFWRQ